MPNEGPKPRHSPKLTTSLLAAAALTVQACAPEVRNPQTHTAADVNAVVEGSSKYEKNEMTSFEKDVNFWTNQHYSATDQQGEKTAENMLYQLQNRAHALAAKYQEQVPKLKELLGRIEAELKNNDGTTEQKDEKQAQIKNAAANVAEAFAKDEGLPDR